MQSGIAVTKSRRTYARCNFSTTQPQQCFNPNQASLVCKPCQPHLPTLPPCGWGQPHQAVIRFLQSPDVGLVHNARSKYSKAGT